MNGETGLGCLILIIILLGVYGLNYGTEELRCSKKADALGYTHDYKLWQGCVLIKPDGKRVLLEQLRDFDR